MSEDKPGHPNNKLARCTASDMPERTAPGHQQQRNAGTYYVQ